jgi:cytochrome c-type biogenesis protein
MMDAEALRQTIENAGIAAAGVAFLAGLLFSFNPVALASIPVSLAYVTRGRDTGQALLFGAMFILGMILTHVVLGLIAGLGANGSRASPEGPGDCFSGRCSSCSA